MTEATARRRQGKKRVLAIILDAMHRLDAIFPETRPDTIDFGTLIMFCQLILADGKIHPLETRLLTRLVSPRIKLRKDDVELICSRLKERRTSDKHLDWLVTFLQSSMTPESRCELAGSLAELAIADNHLHPAELQVIQHARLLLGLDTARLAANR
jgi:uncharacterized tellurite resistance protein B-like protein